MYLLTTSVLEKSINTIKNEMESLVLLINQQGILPIVSLVIPRNDKHVTKVSIINKELIILCNNVGAGYVEHENIKKPSSKSWRIHIMKQHNHLLNDNFVKFLNYLVDNNFCTVI